MWFKRFRQWLPPPSAFQSSRGNTRPTAVKPRLEVLEDRSLLSTTFLDPTFGTGGMAQTDLAAMDAALSLAIQPDGTIVVAGAARTSSYSSDFAVARYDAFGNTLWTRTYDFGSDQDTATAVTSQIWNYNVGNLVAGWTGAGDKADFALVRYLPNGAIDTNWGDGHNGKVTTDFLGTDYARGIAFRNYPGPFVVAGATNSSYGGQYHFALAEYGSNGGLYVGSAYTSSVTGAYHAIDWLSVSVAVQPMDDKILLAGSLDGRFVVQRLLEDATPDSSFNNGLSYVETFIDPQAYARCMALMPDGRIVVGGGIEGGGTALARFLPTGQFDPTFNSDGTAITFFGSANSIAIQPDGSIITAGQDVLQRFLPNGQPDLSFGTNGRFVLPGNYLNSVALQPNGKIVTAGYVQTGNFTSDFSVARVSVQTFQLSAYQIRFAILSILGTSGDNSLEIYDDGHQGIMVRDAGTRLRTFTGIRRLHIATFAGNDIVRYQLRPNRAGKLQPADLALHLGLGADAFILTADFGQSHPNIARPWRIDVHAGAGIDLVRTEMRGAVSVRLTVDLGRQNDVALLPFVDLLPSHQSLTVCAGPGHDNIQVPDVGFTEAFAPGRLATVPLLNSTLRLRVDGALFLALVDQATLPTWLAALEPARGLSR